MARRPFSTPAALIVVSTDGYFDVFTPSPRRPNARPSYRGAIAELGSGMRADGDRLAVRPDSAVLARAVTAWSRSHGASAVEGKLGLGRGEATS